jgi:UDP-glucose 4-epimerase
MSRTALVTGGAGYIGSHTCVAMLAAGWDVVVVDDLSNSSEIALDRVREITGRDLGFHRVNLLDGAALGAVFDGHSFDAVVHFAALKAVGESTEIPLDYYRNNVGGTLELLRVMAERGVRDLVFSSSCTVYGEPATFPVREDFALYATSPYGRTKLFIEEILRDVAAAEEGWHIALLRYFNPVGAHPSGRIGEDPRGIPMSLLPYVMQVAVGRHPFVRVWGDDYPTPDGTGVRDYLHVVDLADGHLAALDALAGIAGCEAYNLGTGRGHSVLEVLAAAREATGKEIPHEVLARRPGDIAQTWADPGRAERELGWRAHRDLAEMCRDAWNWQSQNPNGFAPPG